LRVLEEDGRVRFFNWMIKFKDLVFTSTILKPQEMHVEALHNTRVFEKVLEYARKHPDIWYMVMIDYDNSKARAGGLKISEKEYEDIVLRRTKELSTITKNIGLHPHLYIPYEDPLSYESQKKEILRIKGHLDRIGIISSHVSFGYWTWDENTVRICQELGLKIHKRCMALHDYDLMGERT
jgi:hypothetical protein